VITPVPLRDMALTWPSMLVFYFRHLVWPMGLSVFYSVPVIHNTGSLSFTVPCVIVSAVLAGLAAWSARSHAAGFSALLMIVPLLPAMNLRTFARVETVHDRYLYLPSVGFCILAAIALRRLRLGSMSPSRALLPQAAVGVVIGGALGYGTVHESQYWIDNLTLFHRAVAISPNNEIANQCLGTAFLLRNQIADAIPYYQRAVELNPHMPEALYDLGRCYYELGMYSECEQYFERAAQAAPTRAEAYLYYGLAKLKQQQLDVAENVIQRAIRIKGPDDYREYHFSLGLVLQQKGNLQGALREFEAEARENPDPFKALEQIAALKSRLVGKQ
jgi:tetratricopeptide (TPR) repeat protein